MNKTNRPQKPIVLGLALVAVVMLAACSTESPTSPQPQPTPAANSVSLTASPSSPGLGEVVTLTARVTRGSSNAPDGTSVTFVITGCSPVSASPAYFENGVCQISKATSAGVAKTTLTASVAGTYEIRAAVPGVEAKINVTFVTVPPTPTPTPTPTYEPHINAISPNSGPIEGGTRVTIFGYGFHSPVQVFFGDRQAQVVSVAYDQVIALSPNISPVQPNTPTTVAITVKNVSNGLTSNGIDFRYGEALFISGISPAEGPANAATIVTIYGQGFAAPVRVQIAVASGIDAEVLSVAGTEIQARFPALPASARSCGDTGGTVTVTNLNSNLVAEGPSFTYRAIRPLITSAEVDSAASNVVPEFLPPLCNTTWSSHTLIVRGSGFTVREGTLQSSMVVTIGNIGPIPTTYVNENEVRVNPPYFPDLTGITLNTTQCLVGTDTGVRYIDTPVPLTVLNQDNSCSDTLTGALIIRPCDTTCRLAPSVNTISPIQGPLAGGTPVAIVGQNMTCPVTVLFGGAAAAVNTCTATLITVTAPAAPTGLAGPVDIDIIFGAETVNRGSAYTYTANLSVSGVGTGIGGITSASGINCGWDGATSSGTCNALVLTPLDTLTATAGVGSVFAGWGSACASCGTTAICNLSMNGDPLGCTATFNPAP
ncbi:MAG: IPT/TIG domain-containing protein [Acidobacteriota bacterium]